MVSFRDIPFVGNLFNRVENTTVDVAILRVRYLLRYKSLIKLVKTQVDKLKIEDDDISRKAVAERDDGKVIKDHVLTWQQDVENVNNDVKNLLESYEQRPSWMCFKDIPFAKPVSRFRLGKQAAEAAKTVTELTNLGKEYRDGEIAHHPPKENVPISDTTYQSFKSREEAYGKLWEALVNEDRQSIIGIYGMPGVGKTQMMEEAWKQAKEKGIFSKVTRANIGSEKIDVIKVQQQLAGYLDCHLKSKDNVEDRASQLSTSLINGGKTLVILDDVWGIIPLNQIGVPFVDGRSKGCKILLTSRNRDVCLLNNCEDPIQIKMLTKTEAWDMFENTVGTSKVKALREPLLAKKVCTKCGRLPLLISAVGKAVKVMTENSWKDALSELENCRYEEIAGLEPGVYACLKFSFDKLTEAGKTCLLLCSLYREDANIDIKELSNLATGSQLLNRQKNIAGVVDILKSSSMILQGEYDGMVKLHDIIRDIARTIAAKDPKYAFLSIRCRLGLPDSTDYHSRRLLHLDLEGKNVCFPNDLVCPDLHTLWLQCNNNPQKLSGGFLEGVANHSFLLQGMTFPEQQLSIHRLEKLKMIIINDCHIDETFFSSVSKNLETLCIKHCHLASPLDLSKLKNLRKLELVIGRAIKMVPDSISSLSRLEELIIPTGFTIWEDADADAKSIYVELNKLTQLRNLTISLPYSQSYLNEDIMSNLVEFNIYVGFTTHFEGRYLSNNSITFVVNHIESGWMALAGRAEELSFDVAEGLFDSLKGIEEFANLKKLEIWSCHEMNQPLAFFSNLCFLTINNCQGSTCLFSASVAKCLLNIQQLQVYDCRAIEEIVRVDYSPTDQGDVIVSFPKLKVLHLKGLSSLKSFSTHKVAFPSLDELSIMHLENAIEIWGKGIYNQEGSSSFGQLKVLRVKGCYKLENVIPVTLLHEFKKLEHVAIESCESLRTVFKVSSIATDIGNLDETDGRRIVFSNLKELRLTKLPNIKSFWSYDHETVELNSNLPHKVSFPNMEVFEMWQCKTSGLAEEIELGRNDTSPSKLIYLKLSHVDEVQLIQSQWALQLQNLQQLLLENFMWHENSLFNTSTLTPNRLTVLNLNNCELGPTLFTTSCFRSFQQLKQLQVYGCNLLEEIVEEDIGMDDEKIISLPSLHSLDLFDLPNLKSFSQSSTYAFHMPALESISLYYCPRMDKFTSLPINAPLLQVSVNWPIQISVAM